MADGLAPRVEPCTLQTLDEWVALRHALWPDGSEQDHRADAQALLWEQKEAVALLVRLGNGTAAGFAEAALRRDYVNGCSTSPVGFLEGIYVKPEYRHRGLARLLHLFEPHATLLRRSDGASFKTGTFSGVRTLAGYADTSKHGRVRFVIALTGNDGAMRFRLLKAIRSEL